MSSGYSSGSNPSAPPWKKNEYGAPPPPSYGAPPAYAQPYYSNPNPNPGQWGGPGPGAPPPGGQPYPSSSAYPPPHGYPPYGGGGGQYPQPPVASLFPPGTDPDIVRAFQMADADGSGLIDDYELQKALYGQKFSLRTVRLMIHLFGAKGSLKIGPKDFATLWKQLKEFKTVFGRFDMDRSETVDSREMKDALLSLGYAISPAILQCLLQKYDRTGQGRAMDYDSFVECGFIVKGLTDKFKEKDVKYTGSATLTYEEFMLMVLPFLSM